jgi:hypothetical protein
MITYDVEWSHTILNYGRIVERYPKPNGMGGGSIPTRTIFSILDEEN